MVDDCVARVLLSAVACLVVGVATPIVAQVPSAGTTFAALTDTAIAPSQGRAQLLVALDQAAREPGIVQDTVAAAVVALLRRRAGQTAPEVAITRDSMGPVVFGYIDLSNDASYVGELRLRRAARHGVVLGVTTRHCGDACRRDVDLAIVWSSRDSATWETERIVRRVAEGEPIVLAAVPPTASDRGIMPKAPAAPAVITTVRGTVRSEQGQPIPNLEVFSADGSASTLSDANGAYQLTLNMPPGGVLLSTRRIGFAPAFRTVRADEGPAITWEPSPKALTVLTRQLVTATGVPDALRLPRYADFLARRAKGVGQFFMTEDIWSAMSLGDVLNRANGVQVSFTFGNQIRFIRFPACQAPYVVGVYIDGINETTAGRTAEQTLSQFVTSAIVAMEVYRFRGEIPGDFVRPEYCAVIALWTR